MGSRCRREEVLRDACIAPIPDPDLNTRVRNHCPLLKSDRTVVCSRSVVGFGHMTPQVDPLLPAPAPSYPVAGIAAGAGVEPHQVNELVKQFDGIADVMKQMSGMSMKGKMKAMQELTQGAMANPGGKFSKKKQGTGKRLSPKEKAKMKKLREKESRRRRRGSKRDKPR